MDIQYIAIIALLVIIFYYVFIRKSSGNILNDDCGEWDLSEEIKEFNKIQKKYILGLKTL